MVLFMPRGLCIGVRDERVRSTQKRGKKERKEKRVRN